MAEFFQQHDDPMVNELFMVVSQYQQKLVGVDVLRNAIRNLRKNGTAEQWNAYVNEFEAQQHHNDAIYQKQLAEMRERKRESRILKPFNIIQKRNRQNPTLPMVEELIALIPELQDEGVLQTGSPSLGTWDWTDTASYPGNDNVKIERNNRVVYEGAIKAQPDIEFTESASGSYNIADKTYRLYYSIWEYNNGEGYWRYIETGDPDNPYTVEPVIITHEPKDFDTLESMFAFIESISPVDYTPDLELG